MTEEIKKLISQGEFLKAKKNLDEIHISNLKTILLNIGYDNENICAYSFICFLILEKESIEYHILAFEILINCFAHLVGGYQTALYHKRRAIELDPNNVELQEDLLFFNEIPEKLINDQEAKEIALKILRQKPNSDAARMTLMDVEAKNK